MVLLFMDLPPIKTDIEEGKQPNPLVFISKLVFVFLHDSHLNLKNMQRRQEKAAHPSPKAMAGECLLLGYSASVTLPHNISLVLERMQLESKPSRTEGKQEWQGLSAPGE